VGLIPTQVIKFVVCLVTNNLYEELIISTEMLGVCDLGPATLRWCRSDLGCSTTKKKTLQHIYCILYAGTTISRSLPSCFFFMLSAVLFTGVNDYKHKTQFIQPLQGHVKYQFISANYIFWLVKSHFQVTSRNFVV